MGIYFVVLALLILIGPKNSLRLRGIPEDYLSKDNTDAIRGIFILLILICHYLWTIPWVAKPAIDSVCWTIRDHLEQLVVAPFLFFSGYGIAEAIRAKGRSYTRGIPRTRILRILFIYGLIQVCFLIINRIFDRPSQPLLPVFLALVGIGSDNWYIFDILMCYGFTWLAFTLLPEREKPAAALVTLLCVGLIAYFLTHGYRSFWYDSLLCYPLGLWYSIYHRRAEKLLRNDLLYLLALLVCGGIFYMAYVRRERMLYYELHTCVFALLTVLVSMKFTCGNPFLRWCGKNLMSLFLVHRIPMVILNELVFPRDYRLRFVLYWVCTIALSAAFSRLVRVINKLPVFRPSAVRGPRAETP